MPKRTIVRAVLPALALGLVSVTSLPVLAASPGPRKGGESADETTAIFERGLELVREGKYREALARFEQAYKKDEKNPDAST
jgi:Tfp pilus assembly protein PilF